MAEIISFPNPNTVVQFPYTENLRSNLLDELLKDVLKEIALKRIEKGQPLAPLDQKRAYLRETLNTIIPNEGTIDEQRRYAKARWDVWMLSFSK